MLFYIEYDNDAKEHIFWLNENGKRVLLLYRILWNSEEYETKYLTLSNATNNLIHQNTITFWKISRV